MRNKSTKFLKLIDLVKNNQLSLDDVREYLGVDYTDWLELYGLVDNLVQKARDFEFARDYAIKMTKLFEYGIGLRLVEIATERIDNIERQYQNINSLYTKEKNKVKRNENRFKETSEIWEAAKKEYQAIKTLRIERDRLAKDLAIQEAWIAKNIGEGNLDYYCADFANQSKESLLDLYDKAETNYDSYLLLSIIGII